MFKGINNDKEISAFTDMMRQDLNHSVQTASKKYNFNFTEQRPVEGSETTDKDEFAQPSNSSKLNYSWLKLSKQDSAPEVGTPKLQCPAVKVRVPKRMTIPMLTSDKSGNDRFSFIQNDNRASIFTSSTASKATAFDSSMVESQVSGVSIGKFSISDKSFIFNNKSSVAKPSQSYARYEEEHRESCESINDRGSLLEGFQKLESAVTLRNSQKQDLASDLTRQDGFVGLIDSARSGDSTGSAGGRRHELTSRHRIQQIAEESSSNPFSAQKAYEDDESEDMKDEGCNVDADEEIASSRPQMPVAAHKIRVEKPKTTFQRLDQQRQTFE